MKNSRLSLLIALLVGIYIGICKLGTPVAQAVESPPTMKFADFNKIKPFDLDINLKKGTVKAQGCSPEVNVTITTATKAYPYVVYKKVETPVVKWIEVDKSIINSLENSKPALLEGLR